MIPLIFLKWIRCSLGIPIGRLPRLVSLVPPLLSATADKGVTRVQAGDAGGGLEIALDCVFDCKYPYEHKKVIFSIPKQAFGELRPGFEGVTQGCFNMDTYACPLLEGVFD